MSDRAIVGSVGARLIFFVIFLVAQVAAAQPDPEPEQPAPPPKSTAEVLFEQGLEQMQAGKYDTGCPALAESYRLEPLPGALFTLAECERLWGKLSTARGHYLEYLSQVDRMATEKKARQGERPKVAKEHADELEAEVPRLTILLGDGVPETAIVKRDAVLVPTTQLGRSIPLDPGKHELSLDVPGEPTVTKTVNLVAGQNERVTLALPPKKKPDPVPDPDKNHGDESMSSMRLAAYIVGGVGIAGLITGTIAGAIAINRANEIEENCVGLVCNETGISKVETVREAGDIATVALVIGGAGIAAGIVLWILADEAEAQEEKESGLLLTPTGVGFRW